MKYHCTKKVRILITFAALTLVSNLIAQNTIKDIPVLDSLEITKAVSYFKINDASLEGDGATIVKQYISNSKFFVLGEYHFSIEISKLTTGLAPILDKAGYKAAAFEVGPFSAKKLEELSHIPDSTRARLKAFNGNYFVQLTPDYKLLPLPFFTSVYDADFLEAFAKTDMDIWGVDQELFTSILFMGGAVVESKSKDVQYEEIKTAWAKAKKSIVAKFENPDLSNIPATLDSVRKDPDFQQFRNMFDANDSYAQSVFQRFDESYEIYISSVHEGRVHYLRSNFLKNYEAFEKENKDARYFIKIGSLHAGKTMISNGYYDLGALTQEIATMENATSTNAIVFKAYLNDKDYRSRRVPSLINFSKKDSWTVIDLKKLRETLHSGKFQISTHLEFQELNKVMLGFDLLFIPPVDKSPSDNM